jgi:FkbM family methyltransferase
MWMENTLKAILKRILPASVWTVLRKQLKPTPHETFLRHIHLANTDGLEYLGTEYGGWTIPVKPLDHNSVCYCVGAGENVTFDVALLKRFGCPVHIFDPTPRAIQHVQKLRENTEQDVSTPINDVIYDINKADLQKLHFHDFGFAGQDATLKFFAPRNPSHVSHSVANAFKTDNYFEAQCYTVKTVMTMLGHNHITLLKLDIEGAEYAVIESLINDNIRPDILCLEWFEGHVKIDNDFMSRILGHLKQLQKFGYQPVSVKGWDLTMVKKELLS